MRKLFKCLVLFSSFFLIRLFGRFKSQTTDFGVRVLLLHNVSDRNFVRLEKLVYILSKNWDFISPDQFKLYRKGEFKLKRKSLMVTFDDGFLSSYFASINILEPLGIYSIFFVPTGFIDAGVNDEDARDYLISNLHVDLDGSIVPTSMRPMSWDQVRELAGRGNTIGSHTVNHINVKDSNGPELAWELSKSRRTLSDLVDSEVSDFAYPFGDADSISPQSFRMSTVEYENVYSGFRGGNFSGSKSIVCRDSIDLEDPYIISSLYLEGGGDFIYKSVVRLYSR